MIVVDDDSRDGTRQTCRRLAGTNPLRLITRCGERGLATAVLRGLERSTGRSVRGDGRRPFTSAGVGARTGRSSPITGLRFGDGKPIYQGWSRRRELELVSPSELKSGVRSLHGDSRMRPIRCQASSRLGGIRSHCAKNMRPVGLQDWARVDCALQLFGISLRFPSCFATVRLGRVSCQLLNSSTTYDIWAGYTPPDLPPEDQSFSPLPPIEHAGPSSGSVKPTAWTGGFSP